MRIGLKFGDRDGDVERLQRVLLSAGFEILAPELKDRRFGSSTLAAMQAVQRRANLPSTREIDEATLEILLKVEERITVNIYESGEPKPAPTPPDPTKGIVTGTLTDEDGSPIAQTLVTLLSVQIRSQGEIGSATTDALGAYRITYKRKAPINLAVTATDAAGKTLATSSTVFAAPANVVIDFTTAPGGVVRQPSQYAKVLAAVNAGLQGTSLLDLHENSQTHELTFLANSIGLPFRQIAYLYVADALAQRNGLSPQTLYGLFVEGTPPTLDAALADLPEAGIDDSFTNQTFASVLAQIRATLNGALTSAISADVLPASYSNSLSSELDKIDALRVTNVGSSPYITGKTALNDVLAAGNVTAQAQSAFLSAYAASGGRLGPTWSALRANTNLPAADLKTLQTTLSASQLLRGNLPLLKDTMQRIGAGTLASVPDLALLDQSDWEARIEQVDPGATSIPPVLPDETVAQRIARLAKSLAARFASRYQTAAFVGGLTKATTSSFKTKAELITFLTANPKLSFRTTNIDNFILTNKLTISPESLAELKTVQRLHRVSPHYTSVEALNAAGFTSAQKIYFAGRAPFIASMSGALGSEPLAEMAFARAQMNYATTLMAWGRYNLALNGTSVSSITSSSPPPGTLANLPDLQALFGSLDYFQCEDCQSVYSPAAYLVDLLQYLSWFKATPLAGSTPPVSAIATARDALLLRRPDIEYVALSCDNTNTIIPYIDLVNEILEAAIAPVSIARPTNIDTEGTTAERAAVPQQTQPAVATAAYTATASVTYPFNLPFDINFAQATAYIAALGTTRATFLQLFPISSGTVAAAMLGLSSEMQNVVVTVDTTDPWTRWGFVQNPSPVIDPETRQPYTPNPADWVAALNYVPVLMSRTGLTLQQLYQLLEVLWVTQGTVTLQVGTTTIAGLQVLDADAGAMVFTGLTSAVLDRANRYLRLWTASGLQMWELDWALENAVGGTLDNTFLEFLANAIAVKTQLNLPFQEVLTFWSQIETRDVTSHLGDEDAVVPSTYTEVFANPTMLASWSGLFSNSATLSGAQIVYPASASPTSAQLQPLGGITAAFGLDAADISAILAASGAANTLTLPTLTALLRYQRLASSLSLSVSDLILWIELTDQTPFGGSPQDTLEFLRRLSVLQGTGMAVHDIDYLLRSESLTQSSLTFTSAQSTTVLQTIRDAIAKLTSTSGGTTQLTLTAVSGGSPIAVTTVQPHGLATGNLVLVAGVTGNTAANGIFAVTVTSTTAFTLNGSTGNGAWTGGGSVTTNLASTIQTIVVASLVSATGVTADVVTPVLNGTNVLPLSLAAIQALLAQPTVDPTQFTTLISAFTQVDKAASLFTALAPPSAAFAFLVQNAATFGWLNPGTLPLAPISSIPYLAFEKLLRALALQQRLAARTPKLFDVLGQWVAGPLPADVPTALAGPTLTITAATNATPIAITTSTNHDLQTGQQVTIGLVAGNTAANSTYTITVTGLTTFTLDGSIGNGTYTGGGVVNLPNAYCIAAALNATIADITAVATKLGATAPSLTPTTQAGTLADIGTLTQIANALNVLVRYGISGATLVQLTSATPDADTSSAAMAAFQAQYGQNSWLAAATPVENTLRQKRRDALVAYLLGSGPVASPGAAFLTTDDIFDYYLIDPEMCACGQTTRLLQPSLAIQHFVTQCFINLTINATVDTTDPRWTEWSWRQQYRLWQANREVFLYPENYVLPELLPNASPFFSSLQNTIAQSNCDADAVESAYESYLRSLVSVARLRVAAHYIQPNGTTEGATLLWVFARSRGNPAQWWYRTRTVLAPGSGVWSAWQTLNLDIASDQVMPAIWDQRLYLVWPIFHLESERQSSQNVPPSGGGSSPPPLKFWAVEFATSDFSAGQWQAKQTYDQRMFILKNIEPLVDRPQMAFTFKAYQDNSFNLQLQMYYTLSAAELLVRGIFGGLDGSAQTYLIGNGTLTLPDAPLYVTQDPFYMPLPPAGSPPVVDPTQEPTFASVTQQTETGYLIAPQGYSFCGQDYINGEWWQPTIGSAQLNVLAEQTAKTTPASLTLLDTIATPRIVIPQQEPTFDSLDPFFVDDTSRTYLVQPEFYTLGSRPTELDNLAYINQWSTSFVFQTFYHPYARTFLRELEVGGVSQLLSRNLQINPQEVRGWPTTFDFQTIYNPQPPVATPYPGASGAPDPGETALDFEPGYNGAYSLYNFETFFFVPWFISNQLLANNQYTDALTWIEYIFNPTDNSGGPSPQRFWEFAPFYQLQSSDWIAQQIQNLLTTLATDTQQGISDPATTSAILAWMNDPFDPHAIASTRISAYAKAIVMQALNIVIALGDSLYAVYTAENVAQAEQWYILADMILGPIPNELRLPSSQQSTPPTYASLKNLDIFSNTLVNVENLIVSPEPPQSLVDGSSGSPSLPMFPGNGNTLLFCIPPNEQLLAYWGTIAQRLYNIRNCLNMQGVAQPLPLYAPPINPMQLIEEEAAGGAGLGATSVAPIYRFQTYLQKAIDITSDVRSYGALILAALEKQDAETLALLRANQEVTIQTMMLNVKQLQVTEAQDQITVLQNQQAVVQIRYNFYSSQAFMNASEIAAMTLQGQAQIANAVAVTLDITAGIAQAVPTFTFGGAGFGGSPEVSVSYGGGNVGASVSAFASVARGIGGLLSESGRMAATLGSYEHRQDEWTLQANLAQAELTQLASQITAANDRLQIAQNELSIQNTQITNAQAISTFLTNKYTNAQLYNWMVSQLSTVYAQAYQLAFSLAQQAQTAYQYELGRPLDQFIQFAYWNSQYKGLTAGESLLFDIRRMEAQFIANNARELELTKHISLALTQPLALVQLLQTGSCMIALDETLFDFDHPGHYFRRLRSVALTIPCVTGPYTGVNATLTLAQSVVRTAAPSAGFQPWIWATSSTNTDPNIAGSPAVSASPIIATSSGQSDSGLFEVNLRDERWLPCEGQGAVCMTSLELDPRDNNFDLSSVTDVILHIRYSARPGGDANAVRAALLPVGTRTILVSVRNTFGDNYYSFFNPTDTTATQQTLTMALAPPIFPYSNLGTPTITDVTMIIALSEPLSAAESSALGSMSIQGTFGPSGGTTQNVTFTPAVGTAPGGGPIPALAADAPYGAGTPTGSFTLTIPSANIPASLQVSGSSPALFNSAAFDDIVLLITYQLKS